MKKYLLTLALLLPLAVMAQTKNPMFKIVPADSIHMLFEMSYSNDAHTQFAFSFNDDMVVVNFKNKKPIAEKPYSVFVRNHSLIVFKNGKKVGAFKMIPKIYELTNLKLN